MRDLKARPGGDIGVHGSIELARSMLEAGLVDELQLVVGPVTGQPGRRLFTSDDQVRRLELLERRTHAQLQPAARLPRALSRRGQVVDGSPPGGPVRTVGTYSSSWSLPSNVRLPTISRPTSGYPS